jgi:hypothetical protein
MSQSSGHSPLTIPSHCPIRKPLLALLVFVAALIVPAQILKPQDENSPVDDMTAKYHFLSPEDTLAILDEEGKLKGYIEVTQPQEESDDIISFDIQQGSRQKNHVAFRTNRIHGKFYRFSGTVEHGKGQEEKDSDYLHLVGDLDVVSVNADTGKETVQTLRVTFKSLGVAERPDE